MTLILFSFQIALRRLEGIILLGGVGPAKKVGEFHRCARTSIHHKGYSEVKIGIISQWLESPVTKKT